MSIVAIVSSPKKGGNTDKIVGSIVEGAKENGKDVKVYHLNQLKGAIGCQACFACKKTGYCIQKDDLAEILTAIRESEGIVLSTPVYFGEACAQLRLLLDRFFGYMGADFAPNIAPGKKVATIVTCGGGVDAANALAAKIEGTMAGAFKFEPIGKIVFADGNSPDALSKDTNVLAEAKAIGKKF
jgi:multimeric flavodoxin WrbA